MSSIVATKLPTAMPPSSPSGAKAAKALSTKEGGAAGRDKRFKFPAKLYSLLEYTTACEWSAVVSWSQGGTSFDILDKELICDILPHFFRITKYKSFVSRIEMKIIGIAPTRSRVESIAARRDDKSSRFFSLPCFFQF